MTPTNTKNTKIEISDRDLIAEARLAGKIPDLVRGIVRRKIISAQVTIAGLEPSVLELQQAADRFRLVNHVESGFLWFC